jgi:hypothetical protein
VRWVPSWHAGILISCHILPTLPFCPCRAVTSLVELTIVGNHDQMPHLFSPVMVSSLTMLELLDCAHVPEDLRPLHQLSELVLDGSGTPQHWPSSTTLTRLDLAECELAIFPPSLHSATWLEDLRIDDNPLNLDSSLATLSSLSGLTRLTACRQDHSTQTM